MSVTAICVLGALLRDYILMGVFGLYIATYIIHLLMHARRTLKISHWIVMSMLHFEKSRDCYQFSSFLIVLTFCKYATNQATDAANTY